MRATPITHTYNNRGAWISWRLRGVLMVVVVVVVV